jgi:hypothetical protein
MDLKRIAIALGFVLPLAVPLSAQVTLEDAIDLLGQYRASRLDSVLPRIPFLTWFKSVVRASAKIEWEINDCGEQSGAPAVDTQRDFPTCLEVTATLADGRKAGVAVVVGTVQKGLTGLPQVRSVYLEANGEIHHLKRLSELPRAIEATGKAK